MLTICQGKDLRSHLFCLSQYQGVDLCGYTCDDVINEFGASCSATWADGNCGAPPEGFTAESTLYELCTEECPPEGAM
jgi:hypothetical protein